MDEKDLELLREMEETLDACTAAAADLSAQLERMDALREKMIRLHAYYGSEDWYRHREAKLPAGTKAGVLSEDAVYDEISALREAALHMLELATDILRNRL
jgi:hypothetical protein